MLENQAGPRPENH